MVSSCVKRDWTLGKKNEAQSCPGRWGGVTVPAGVQVERGIEGGGCGHGGMGWGWNSPEDFPVKTWRFLVGSAVIGPQMRS